MSYLKRLYKRLGIISDVIESRKKFASSINNVLFISDFLTDYERKNLIWPFCIKEMSDYNEAYSLKSCIVIYDYDDEFEKYLSNIQILLDILNEEGKRDKYDSLIKCIDYTLENLPLDIGLRLKRNKKNYVLVPKGSELLDEKLIDDVLNILENKEDKMDIIKPFNKGIREFLSAKENKDRLKNVIRDIYESLESTAKHICGNKKDLSGNRELFIKKINANDYYKKILKEYINFANEYRHPPKSDSNLSLSRKEVETFIYLTGIFIRFALQ